MIRVELFLSDNYVRAMLWPQFSITELLKEAEAAGHISKISRLDQYHQFTLSSTGAERMTSLLSENLQNSTWESNPKSSSAEEQLPLFPVLNDTVTLTKEDS